MNIPFSKHLFILSACLLPLLTQCGDGGKTIDELYTDKRPNDFVKVTAEDIKELKNGDSFQFDNKAAPANPISIQVTLTTATAATVLVIQKTLQPTDPPSENPPTDTGIETTYNNVKVTWTSEPNSQYTLKLEGTTGNQALNEEVTMTLELNQARKAGKSRAEIQGKITQQKAQGNNGILKENDSALLGIALPKQ